ncbi:MAG: class I SAM-dependent RNA methyltransferase [Hyphomicrobiaceae bacterium]|nr:class I SAM-dependent RNA methyltransferase [Hyphomicrobiaceae bacterium]
MSEADIFEIFLVAVPGLETALRDEALEAGFAGAKAVEGGVSFEGHWTDVWRANLDLRGPTRVLVRIASFRALHLAQLDKRARKLAWGEFLRPDVPVQVEASCRKSRIYHAGAAAERVTRAIVDGLGVTVAEDSPVRVLVRIDRDLCTISLDTSGPSLHKRGFKQGVAKAPMRETMAALFLRQCGFDGTESVLDPMCGSGTFVIEAAEMAVGLKPGRARAFAFEQLAGFDADAWQAMRQGSEPREVTTTFLGSDLDPGAVRMAEENAERAGVDAFCQFTCRDIAALERPAGPPGLVIVNPPYGARIGNKSKAPLRALHRQLGLVLAERFSGWRVGLVTADPDFAKATGLPFVDPLPPVLHGGLRIALYRTAALK